ncbi:MAG: hypothetical protein NVS3B29_03060 [Candidatus Saccharimonadales bacterium]
MTKTKRPRPDKSISPYRLAKGAVKDLRAGWKGYLWILAIITVPYSLIGLSASLSSSGAVGAYGYVAVLIMNAAMLYAAVRQEQDGAVPRPGSAYYDGSAIMVRLLVICALLVVMLIPLIIGLVLYVVGATALDTVGSPVEILLIALVALIISIPSIVLLVRFGLAPVVSVVTGLRPLAALRRSRQLTLGRFWPVFSRYAALLLFMIVTALPIAALTALLAFLKFGVFAAFLFGLITTFLAVPLFNLYLLHLYRALEATMPKVELSEPAA